MRVYEKPGGYRINNSIDPLMKNIYGQSKNENRVLDLCLLRLFTFLSGHDDRSSLPGNAKEDLIRNLP